MTVTNESIGASMVKVSAVAMGAALSHLEALGSVLQVLVALVTVIYGIFQIFKMIPWFTDQTIAFWRGVLHGDWSRWWQIARREEKSNDGDSNV